jgi:NAD(P)-dependent dehydrogenase (short-subunit alcohol dehydrogenase family)
VTAVVDVSKSSEVDEWIRSTKDTFGRIDGAVNNAGIIGAMKPISQLTDDEFAKVLNINLVGVFNCLRAELNTIETGGSIVNTSSIAGLVGVAGAGAYVTSKHGIIGLTRSAAREATEKGVRVNAVCPGLVHTPMLDEIHDVTGGGFSPADVPQAIKREGKPEEIAALFAYLLGDESKFTTGTAIPVDGGWTC